MILNSARVIRARNLGASVLTHALILGLIIFACRVMFSGGALGFQDLAPMIRQEQLFRALDFPWDGKSNLGGPNLVPGNMLYSGTLIVVSTLLGSVELGHKMLFLLMFAGAGEGFYLLSRTFFAGASRKASLISALFFLFNPWIVFHTGYGHNTILYGLAIIPYVLALYFSCFKAPKRLDLIVCGLASGLLFWASFHLSYLFFMLIFLHGAFHVLIGKARRRSVAIRWISILLVVGVSTVAIASPLLFHILRVNIPAFVVRPEEPSHLSTTIYSGPVDVLHLELAILTLGLGLVYGADELGSQFLVFLASVSAVLALGAFWPMSSVYQLLYEHIPFFYIFRDASRFFLLSEICSGLAVAKMSDVWMRQVYDALASSRRRLFEVFRIGRKGAPSGLLLMLVIASLVSVPLSGNYAGSIRLVNVPAHYRELDDWLRGQADNFRVALLPPATWATRYNWTRDWFLDPMVALQAKPTIELKGEQDVTLSASFVRWIYNSIYGNMTQYWGRLLGLLGVKYVILRGDADMPEFIGGLRDFNLSATVRLLQSQKDLKLIKTIGPLKIYENQQYLARLYSAEKISVGIADRRLLMSLAYSGQDQLDDPICFLDYATGLPPETSWKRIYLEGNGILELALNLASKHMIEPSRYLEYSGEYWNRWIKGDYSWFLLQGELHVSPISYAVTQGNSRMTIPFTTDSASSNILCVQAYQSPRKDMADMTVLVDSGHVFRVSSDSSNRRGGFKWVLAGEFFVEKGNHELTIQALGGYSAISRLAVIPSRLFIEKIEEATRILQNVPLTYIFENDMFSAPGAAEVRGAEFSCGSAIHLCGSAELSWRVPKEASWTLSIRGRSTSPNGSVIDLTVGAESFAGRFSERLETMSFKLGQQPKRNRAALIKIQSSNGLVLDYVTVSEMLEGSGMALEEATAPIRYRTISDSEHLISQCGRFLVFLESHTSYWRLETDEGTLFPSVVFGYANLYDLSHVKSPNREGRLFYLGLTYVKQGLLAMILMLPFSWLAAATLCRPRWTGRKVALKSRRSIACRPARDAG